MLPLGRKAQPVNAVYGELHVSLQHRGTFCGQNAEL
jgi:hypothetical protein